jgi:NodT family efflux transporter outer membrane factor (OMF) lipoprotein
MLIKRTLVMLTTVILSTACTVGTDYVRPHPALPEHFMGQTVVEQRHANATADLLTWWEGFGDPELNRLITLALADNLDVYQAAARIVQARAGLTAANAALLPSGSISAQGARAYQSLETAQGQILKSSPGFERSGNAYEANLNVGWELDLFGGARRAREAAQAELMATEAGAVAARLAVAAQTADTYISIRGLQARLDVARKQVETQEQLLARINLLYDKGLAADLQVSQVEAALAQARASIPVLAAGLDAAMNALDVMLGTTPGTHREELAHGAPIPAAPELQSTGSPGELLRRRPDLIVAERRLAASNARIGVAIAEYYPKFSLNGLLGSATSISSSNLFGSGASQAAGVLGLRWRLFDFGRINAQIGLAKGQEAEALAAYRLSVLRATEDVENALSALVKREEQASILGQGVKSLSRARGAAFAAYQQGVVSLIEVLQADDKLLQVSDARVQAQTESARAAVAAFRALGGGWQPPPSSVLANR